MDNVMIEKLMDIVREVNVEIPEDYNDTFKLESIQLVMIIASIEDSFDIEIPDDYLEEEKVNSINKMIEMIESLVMEGAH